MMQIIKIVLILHVYSTRQANLLCEDYTGRTAVNISRYNQHGKTE